MDNPMIPARPGPTPYGGLRVVELSTDPAGELTGLQFAHMGADVIKVEPPGGAPSRHAGPYVGGIPDIERSLGNWYYNVGKRSVVLDVATADGRRGLDVLLATADVFIVTLRPRELRHLGCDLAALAAAHPALIVTSITPFGLTGPWADYLSSDLVGMAASGLLITSGYDDHSIPPIRPGGDQTFHTAASFAHIAIGLALVHRQRTGEGGLIDVSMHEAAAVTVELANPYWFYPRGLVQRQTGRHAQPVPTQPAVFECGDGRYVYFALILADQRAWNVLVDWMAEHDLATDLGEEAYQDLGYRQADFGHVQDVIECFFLLQDSSYVYHEGQARGLPIGVLNAPDDLFEDEHLRARGFFVEVDQPGFGPMTVPGVPYRLSAFGAATPSPAPRLGEHTDEVMSALAASSAEPPAIVAAGGAG